MDARYLAIWITTKTDEERDRLRQDLDLHHKLRDALLQVGYPIAAVPLVGFAFESQETGDRDFGGNFSFISGLGSASYLSAWLLRFRWLATAQNEKQRSASNSSSGLC